MWTTAIETQIHWNHGAERKRSNLRYVWWGQPWRCYTYLGYHDHVIAGGISPNWASVRLPYLYYLFIRKSHSQARLASLWVYVRLFFVLWILWPCVAAIWSMMNCMQIWLLLDRTCNLFGFRPWCKGDIAHSTWYMCKYKYKYNNWMYAHEHGFVYQGFWIWMIWVCDMILMKRRASWRTKLVLIIALMLITPSLGSGQHRSPPLKVLPKSNMRMWGYQEDIRKWQYKEMKIWVYQQYEFMNNNKIWGYHEKRIQVYKDLRQILGAGQARWPEH